MSLWRLLWSRAEDAAAAEDGSAESSSNSSSEEPAPVESTSKDPAPSEAPAAAAEEAAAEEPEREPTTDEIAAAKDEIVAEAVDKIMSAVGNDIVVNEVVTAPYDPRFPATNQSRHCFVRYNEYYKCVFERGPEAERCAFYKRAYESLCPEEWVEEWEELREQGLWMGKY